MRVSSQHRGHLGTHIIFCWKNPGSPSGKRQGGPRVKHTRWGSCRNCPVSPDLLSGTPSLRSRAPLCCRDQPPGRTGK